MMGFTWLHWGLVGLVTVLFFLFLYYVSKLRGQTAVVALGILVLVTFMFTYIGVVSLDRATKKATLTKVKNKRILRNEEIVFSGYIVNTGSYTIGKSDLEIKLINHGKATGHVKGTDFYKTNAIFGDLFSNSKDKKKNRPSSLKYTFTIAKDLKAGKRKRFTVRFKFPSYFKDVDFRLELHSDYTSKTIRMK